MGGALARYHSKQDFSRNALKYADRQDETSFECVDSLAPSAQKVVEIISEAVTGKSGKGASETTYVQPKMYVVT
jgi:hypothetical protein